MADASILVEIEAVLPQITQLDDAALARYRSAAATIMAYNSGYTDAQRAQASKLVQVLYAEQERRKGAAPANANTGGSTSKPPASKPPASKNPGKTSGQTQAPPPEPTPPAEPAPAEGDGVGVVLVVGGLTALAAVAGGLVYRSTKQRQGGM